MGEVVVCNKQAGRCLVGTPKSTAATLNFIFINSRLKSKIEPFCFCCAIVYTTTTKALLSSFS